MQSGDFAIAVRLLPMLVVLVVGMLALRASRNRSAQALVAIVLGVSVAITVGDAVARIPDGQLSLKAVLLMVESASVTLSLIGVVRLAPLLAAVSSSRASRRHDVVFGPALIAAEVSPRAESSGSSNRICPHCGGSARVLAKVCRHCELDLPRT